jgi:hypothetical protein
LLIAFFPGPYHKSETANLQKTRRELEKKRADSNQSVSVCVEWRSGGAAHKMLLRCCPFLQKKAALHLRARFFAQTPSKTLILTMFFLPAQLMRM